MNQISNLFINCSSFNNLKYADSTQKIKNKLEFFSEISVMKDIFAKILRYKAQNYRNEKL